MTRKKLNGDSLQLPTRTLIAHCNYKDFVSTLCIRIMDILTRLYNWNIIEFKIKENVKQLAKNATQLLPKFFSIT